jgi:ATP-dependent RNA helicase DHX36
VTQPRRISAIAVAERVAQEQCLEPVGGIIGYQVRLESAASKSTQLLFLTPGVLLRKLQSSPTLHEYTHIVIDEIHERDRYTEFLLITLRDLLPQRSDLRVILMSATLQIDRLLEYWQMFPMAHVQMQGRTFPVQAFFLEQALQMTGYLNDVLGNHAVEDAELDAALAALTNTTNDADPFLVDVPDFADASSVVLTCVMCGRTGFADAIELGSHVALCDGGANEDMEALEERVRGMDATDHVRHVTPQNGDLLGIQDQFEDADEGAKWDGKSPFEIASKNPTGMTLTEEELLNQYQAMHDDEQIDNPLLIEILRFIVKASYGDGAILVFFPGWQEISEFTLWLEGTAPFRDTSKYLILPLHSSIPSKDQRKVLQRPPSGVRKIILSTNIAETSLTIDDVAFVVDTGRAKEKNYDPHLKTSTLQGTWVSRASAKQRRGRAGRTKAGVCFHLFSSRRHASMREFVDSELLRTPLVRC